MELSLNIKTLEFSHGYLDFWFLLKSQKTRHVWLMFPHNISCLNYIRSCVFLSRYMLSTLIQASPHTQLSFVLLAGSQKAVGSVAANVEVKSTESMVQVPAQRLHCSSGCSGICGCQLGGQEHRICGSSPSTVISL